MKKILTVIMLGFIMLFTSVASYAQTFESREMGLSLNLSDSWIQEYVSEFEVGYSHIYDDNEYVIIYEGDIAIPNILMFAEEELKSIADTTVSDEKIAERLSETNDAIVSVKSESVLSKYENYGGKVYYRYEKAYTATAYEYKPTLFYLTSFITIQNNKVYVVGYERNYEGNNHFEDIQMMLETMSFELGEIKIEIDGRRIYSDTAPLLIDGRTFVPIRAVAEEMGYDVLWNPEEQLVGLVSSQKNILFGIGIYSALINMETEIPIDVAPFILDGRTYLPLRAVAEAMDAQVNWNDNERTVEIYK